MLRVKPGKLKQVVLYLEMAESVSSGSGGESLKASCLQDRLSPGSQCMFALFLVATALFPGCFLPVKTAARGLEPP